MHQIKRPRMQRSVEAISSDLTHLVAAVLPELDAAHHLLVYEVGGHIILLWVMPRREDLLPEEPTHTVSSGPENATCQLTYIRSINLHITAKPFRAFVLVLQSKDV